MKLMPDDDNYDVVMEHVAARLQQLNVDGDLALQLLRMAEGTRHGALAR